MKKGTVVILVIAALLFGVCTGYKEGKKEASTKVSYTISNNQTQDTEETDSTLWDTLNPFSEEEEVEEEEKEPRVFDEEFCPYYASLSEDEKIVYGELVTGIEECAEGISISKPITRLKLIDILSYITYEQEQLFWFNGSSSYYSDRDGLVVSVFPNYNEDMMDNLDELKAQVDQEVQNILQLAEGKSDIEAERYFHNYLCTRVQYEYGSNDQNIYSAFVEKKTVCAGYTKALRRLLTERGIPSYYCRGSSINPDTGNPENHAWNIVKLGGQYYGVDVTWDDIYKESDWSVSLVKYEYFNITDESMNRTHTRDLMSLILPGCNGGSYEFEKVYGFTWKQAAANSLKTTVKTPVSSFKEYSKACSDAFIKQGLGTRKVTMITSTDQVITDIDGQKAKSTYKDYMNRIIKYYNMNGWDFTYQYNYVGIGEECTYLVQTMTMKDY